MKQDLIASFRAAIVALVAFTVLTGIVYPLVVMGLGKALFPHQANGSLIEDRGTVVGSELIGQPFSDPGYFWSRRSALGPFEYNAMNSTGANYGPSDEHGNPNPAIHDEVVKRVKALREADPTNTAPIPADLVTASASGLDPHITPAAAYYQADRVARVRQMASADVRALIEQHTESRTFGILGEPRVNVLLLNRALDLASASLRDVARPGGAGAIDAKTGPPR